ncbi:MAG: L-histidine N(alpha)-methyltransferase [Acidobacteria bacterium]|nr:L-histidine N(alpha)-methyltransferase [Acidobacteriota bacterium]
MEPTSGIELTGQARLVDEVRRDLGGSPKRLQPHYLYDALGSKLFEAICALPEYRITRAECQLLSQHARQILAGLEPPTTVVELGCGSGEKLALVVEPWVSSGRLLGIELVDVSVTALQMARRTLSRFDGLTVSLHESTYQEGLAEVARSREPCGGLLVAFLGSNIGNLEPDAAVGFLRSVRAVLQPGDRLLLGADLVKPEPELVLAYDDPLGVTAAFNKNLLVRLNLELGADFDLNQFAHRAVWNSGASRVEMHLESLDAQTVTVAGANLRVQFSAGESIWTESSYKYKMEAIVQMGELAGFGVRDQWVEPAARFATTVFEVW